MFSRKPPPRGGSRRRRASRRDELDDIDDREDTYGDEESDDDDAPRGRSRRRAGAGRRRGRGGLDWDRLDDDAPEDGGDYGPEGEDLPHVRMQKSRKRRLSLVDLCTPLFGYAAALPREDGGVHPVYATFRDQVMTALRRIESDASEHGVDREDARHAAFLLACFIDAQVSDSQWTGKGQWNSEQLAITLHGDADGGKSFFTRLEGLGDRQRAVKEVALVCIAFGFCGEYGKLDMGQRTTVLGEIRQRILRDVHATPMEKLRRLFPDAYTPAAPVESEGPPRRPWWIWASAATIVFALLLYVLLFSLAGPSERALEQIIGEGPGSASGVGGRA